MDRIPPEIWTRIFLYSAIDGADFYEMRQSPWPASQVCHGWRQAALSNPALWSTISVEKRNMDQNNVRSHLAAFKQRLSTFLTLSTSHPLRIQLDLRLAGEEYTDLKKALVSLLWPHSGRWESFSLSERGCPPKWLEVWTNGEAHLRPMPHLKTLSLAALPIVGTSAELETINAFYTLFTECPSLTTLALDGFPGSDLAPGQTHRLLHGIPWQNLRKFTLHLHKTSLSSHIYLHDVLPRLQNLTHLRFKTSRIPEGIVGQFVFPELVGLVLDVPHSDWVLFDFVTPRLEALELNGEARSPGEIGAFITQSQCSIQYLQIDELDTEHGGGAEGFAAQVLPQTPKLRLLSVEQGSLGQCIDILQYLDGKEGSVGLPCPDLEAFNFYVSEEGHGRQGNGDTRYNLLLEGIARILEARWATPTPPTEERTSAKTDSRPSIAPQIRIHVSNAPIHRISGADMIMDRVRKASVVDEVVRVDVDVGFYPSTGDSESALWPDLEYTWFEPLIHMPPGSVGRVLEEMEGGHT